MNNFKIVLLKNEIPYPENSKSWQQLVDIHTKVNSNRECTLLELCLYHDMSPRFYKDLSQLIEDGLIEVQNEK